MRSRGKKSQNVVVFLLKKTFGFLKRKKKMTLLFVPQSRAAILGQSLASKHGLSGVTTGDFTTCIVAVCGTNDVVALAHLDQQSTIEDLVTFARNLAVAPIECRFALSCRTYREDHLDGGTRMQSAGECAPTALPMVHWSLTSRNSNPTPHWLPISQ